jgi:integrase
MQRGLIFKRYKSWFCRYYDTAWVNGKPVRKRVCKRLAPVSEQYRVKKDVALLAEKLLAPLNAGQLLPESAQPLADFIAEKYLPHVARELRPSTVRTYREMFAAHIKPRLGSVTVRDFRTVHGQKLLRDIPGLSHRTLLHVKSFLSGAFKFAKREGVLDGLNPMQDVSAPGRPAKFRGGVYSLEEIEKMLTYLQEPARTVIAVAAFTGLRLSELRGLRWEDFDGSSIRVSRSVWRTHTGPTKNPASESAVPVLPFLQRVLEKHREKTGGEGFIFAGERGSRPLNLPNLALREIRQVIESKGLAWRGWHSFRRGLASNLYGLGVQPKIIQAILRHSDIGTTLAYYVAIPDSESRAALQKLDDELFL